MKKDEAFQKAFLDDAARQSEGVGCPLVAAMVIALIAALVVVIR